MTNSEEQQYGLPTKSVRTPLERLNWLVALTRYNRKKLVAGKNGKPDRYAKIVGAPALTVGIFLADRVNSKTGLFIWTREWISKNIGISIFQTKTGLGQLSEAGFIESWPVEFKGKYHRRLVFPSDAIGVKLVPIASGKVGANLGPTIGLDSEPQVGAELSPVTGKAQEILQDRSALNARAAKFECEFTSPYFEQDDENRWDQYRELYAERPQAICADAQWPDDEDDSDWNVA